MASPEFEVRVECLKCGVVEWFVDHSPDVGMDVEDTITAHAEAGCSQ